MVSSIPAATNELPPQPPPRTQRAVDHQLAALKLWMEAGRSAMERQQQRHPHALLSLTRLARLTEPAFDFKKLALGLDSPNPLPEKLNCDYELTGLKRAYGHQAVQPPSVETAPTSVAPHHLAAARYQKRYYPGQTRARPSRPSHV